jgi:hypothetical protein
MSSEKTGSGITNPGTPSIFAGQVRMMANLKSEISEENQNTNAEDAEAQRARR